MAKLNSLFDEFLHNIEPDDKAVGYAQKAHKPVREHLEKDEEFKDYFVDSFLYGSYKRNTAVGDIKDVDIVVLTNFKPASGDDTPNNVLKKLKSALARYYKDPENPEYQRRSIRINDPLPDKKDAEMTLDIIPAVATDGTDNPLLVPDREVKQWIMSHPKGHFNHTTRLNDKDYSGSRYVPLVKLMKWWWKYQCEVRQPKAKRPQPKGFWVECLTGENFDPRKEDWADLFITTFTYISKRYSKDSGIPNLHDPGLPGELIKTSMEQKEFNIFLDTVGDSLDLAKQAYDETDEVKSSELWREILGEQFPLVEAEEENKKYNFPQQIQLQDYSHRQPMPWEENIIYKLRIDAYIYCNGNRLGGLNSNSRTIQDGLKLHYVAKTNTPSAYSVYWQVVNTGDHARTVVGGLRGQIFPSKNQNYPLSNWEDSLYTGKHWIECFIVKDNVCVARKKFFVNIYNPEFPL